MLPSSDNFFLQDSSLVNGHPYISFINIMCILAYIIKYTGTCISESCRNERDNEKD